MSPKPFVTGYQGYFNPGQEVTLAGGGTKSAAINCGGMSLVGIRLPSVFTGTALTFEVGDSVDGFQAQGTISIDTNPANNDTVTVNGTAITLVTGTPSGLQVKIGADATATALALYTFLVASADTGLAACTYALYGTVITVTAIVHGTAGNAYTLTKSSTHITVSGSGTLTGGGFTPLYDSSGSAVSMTVSAGRAYAVDPKNFQGVAFLKIVSGSTETAGRTLTCTLKGL